MALMTDETITLDTDAQTITEAIELFGDRILIEPIEQEQKSVAGLVLPDNVQKQPTMRGKVIATGPDAKYDLAIGDVVLHAKYGGTLVFFSGDPYLLISSRDIHARIHEQG